MLGRPLQSLEDNMIGNLKPSKLHQNYKFTAVVLLIYPVLETGTRLFCIVFVELPKGALAPLAVRTWLKGTLVRIAQSTAVPTAVRYRR